MYVEDKGNRGIKYSKLGIIKAICFSLLIIVGFSIFQLGIMVLCEAVNLLLTGESITENENATVTVSIIYGVFSSVIAVILYKLIDKKIYTEKAISGGKRINFRRVAILFLFGVVIQWLMFSILNFVFTFFKDAAIFKDYAEMMDSLSGNNTALMYIYTLFLAPVSEEYIFRGIILSYMRQHAPAKIANVVQAAMFGIFHMNLIQGIYAFVGGIIFGYIAEHKKSMLECVLVHMIVNIAGTFVFPIVFTLLESVINPEILYGISGVCSIAAILLLIKMKLLQNDKNGVESL